jgi:riboflavin biosynthesis pyrimidine reductase
MRLLHADPALVPGLSPDPVGVTLDEAGLVAAYLAGCRPDGWVRTNFATSVDGAITGGDGRSGSVNSAADQVVFELLRALSHAVVVGAGTVRSEGYPALDVDPRWQATRRGLGLPVDLPVVAVTSRADVPPSFRDQPVGRVLLATHAASPGLAQAREQLGDDQVLVVGDDVVDDRTLVSALRDRGWSRLICEGGPHLHRSMLAAGVVDEIALSVTPVVVGGDGPRITNGGPLEAAYRPAVLVEEDGTLMGRWLRT